MSAPDPLQPSEDTSSDGLFEALLTLAVRWRLLFAVTLVAALAGLGTSFVLTPLYTARTAVLPPQQPQATGPMATLGTLAAVLGAGVKTPADQFVAFAQSTTVADRLIERFGLLPHYDEKYLVDARRELQRRLRVSMGKKDGIVTIELEDESAQRAADMANQLVDELRGMSDRLALTEAQQRRAFFERFLEETRDKLERAQRELLASGFNTESLKAEPRSAAEGWAQLQARAT
ncbi:MAG: lipopolysaccharide biosynthesis protein, partial [Comamonadaceae bacterium]|nr:lipopolysaccharide biosynthesis protein [Comamonadaceae bacterium]